MPELPEAEITKRKLKPILGRKIAGFWTNWPRGLRVAKSPAFVNRDIKNRGVLGLRRHGKVIFLDLSGGRTLAFHQRMSGKLTIRNEKSEMRNVAKHVHTKVYFKDGSELWFEDPRKFGVVWYGSEENVKGDKYIGALGPDALRLPSQQFSARLLEHSGMTKPVLLRQDVVAGIGNIVADEALWRAKIHPKRRIKEIKKLEMKKLAVAVQKVLARSISAQGTSIRNWGHPDGSAGGFQNYMQVYDRHGEPCRRCKTKIQRIVVASRGTWLCKKCQRLS